jgi:hypothetical protein
MTRIFDDKHMQADNKYSKTRNRSVKSVATEASEKNLQTYRFCTVDRKAPSHAVSQSPG